MKEEKKFRFLRRFLQVVRPKFKTEWEEAFIDEPCVFIGNHCGALGPIDMVSTFPLCEECKAWMNHDMVEPKLLPAYVRQDYWWKPGCKMEWLYTRTIPYIAAAIIPPVLRRAPTILVYHDMRVMTTMRQSLRWLKDGKHLIIFPEQPSGYGSHHNWINTGFLQIAPMYYKATGKALRFYPVHIDYKEHVYRIAKPIAFDPERTLEEQTEEIAAVLAAGLRGEKIERDS